MLLLPIADPLGVLGVAEVILVLSFSQPSPHEFPLSGLAALGFEAVARALSAPVIGKKKSLAVQALASASGRLHRFQTQKEPLSENAANRRKKIQPQQNSDRRRRKKSFQQTLRRKLNRRRSHSRPSVLHPFHFKPLEASSGSISLDGIEVQSTQVEKDIGLETLFVSITKGLLDQPLDFVVQPLNGTIG